MIELGAHSNIKYKLEIKIISNERELMVIQVLIEGIHYELTAIR